MCNVHRFRFGSGCLSAGVGRIAYVFWSSQCSQGLESGSSPTLGTAGPLVRGDFCFNVCTKLMGGFEQSTQQRPVFGAVCHPSSRLKDIPADTSIPMSKTQFDSYRSIMGTAKALPAGFSRTHGDDGDHLTGCTPPPSYQLLGRHHGGRRPCTASLGISVRPRRPLCGCS